MYKSEPPVDVVKGLDEWLFSIRDTVGFDLIKEIALEEGNHGVHASEGRFTIGEAIFKKGTKFYRSILNHEYEHLMDGEITRRHIKTLLENMHPEDLKNTLTNRLILLHAHYEKILESTVERLKADQKFRNLLSSLMQRTKNIPVHDAIKVFLSKEISLQSLGALGHVLSSKEERLTMDRYLKMNYGIPKLYAFVSKPFNLSRIDPRLAEISDPRITIYPELSAIFAELIPEEKAEILHFGSKVAQKNAETLLILARDAGKMELSEVVEILGPAAPNLPRVYNGPALSFQDVRGDLHSAEFAAHGANIFAL
jgi:hypothetical protein